MKHLLLLLCLFAITGCFLSKTNIKAENDIIKAVNDTRLYHSMVLPNQLEVMLISDPSIQKSAAALSVGAGFMQDPKNFQGLAHYLEHMLFLGTKSYPDASAYSDFIQQNGGTENAYTDSAHTNYMLSINNHEFDQALNRFSRFFYEATLDKNYGQKELNAVHSEWTLKSPNDWAIFDRVEELTLNPKHSFNQFSWGNLESLAGQTNKSLHQATNEFYQRYYSANLMKVALISPLSIEEMKALANKYFSVIPNKHTVITSQSEPIANKEHLSKIVHYQPQKELKQLIVKFIIDNSLCFNHIFIPISIKRDFRG